MDDIVKRATIVHFPQDSTHVNAFILKCPVDAVMYAHILYYLVVFLLCKEGRETLHFSWGARYLCSVMLVSKRPCIIVSKMTFELVKRLKDLRGQSLKSLEKYFFFFFQIYHKWRAQSQIVHGTLCRHVHRNFALRIFH